MHGEAARICRIGGLCSLPLLRVGETVVVDIRVGGVSQAIPVGVLGLTRVGGEGIEKVDDAIAIGIGEVSAWALDHLEGGNTVEDIEARTGCGDIQGLAGGASTPTSRGASG